MLSRTQKFVGVGILVVAVAAVLAIVFSGRREKLTVAELTNRGRKHFMLGRLDAAILDYHRALNDEPDNKQLQYENFLVEQRIGFAGGGDQKTAIAAARRVEDSGDYPLMGTVALAQIYQKAGMAQQSRDKALSALGEAKTNSDSAAQIAAEEVLSSYYRSVAQFDSAFFYASNAMPLAAGIDDTFHLAVARVSAGISALRIDSLDFAHRTFQDLLKYKGVSESEFVPVAAVGLADYFERSGEFDSTLFYLDTIKDRYGPKSHDAIASYALQILGRTYSDYERYDEAVKVLQRSLGITQQLNNIADAIDIMNDLANCYRQSHDWHNARKYYMAAGNLAKHFNFDAKDKYTADLNNLFLKRLKASDYKRAGEEGLELAKQFESGA